ncbi:hypothetical protein IMZ48_43255 [Candidatus Bathyarchaeota archaeon]|nr:hypothetical protein [Candidatus Bathyarchaeota archaeon]
MSAALHRLSSHEAIAQRFCIFIDGLDEYHGEHRDLISVLQGLSTGGNFKLCVSSRPWNTFEDSLGTDTAKKLYLHELTQHDIQQYTSSTLQQDMNWKVSALTDIRYNELTEEITTKSQGVFLWVVLVVRSVLDGLSNGDSIRMLERRIKEIPRDLGPFFKHILRSISSIYHKQTALYFRVALDAPQALTLMHYWFLDQCVESDQSALDALIQPMDNHDVFHRHTTMRRRLNACCKGLLEVNLNPPERRAYLSQNVAFLHRTVRDFLQTDEMARFLEDLLGGYPVNTVMLMTYVAFIKSLPPDGPIKPLLKEALVYAGMAEKESPEPVTACVDELHRTVVDMAFIGPHSTKMARLAVQSGLRGYVSEGIKAHLAGFEDASMLLDIALETSTSAAVPEQVDMPGMVRFLLDAGAGLSDERWADHLTSVSTTIKRDNSEPEAASRQRDILNLLLPLVMNAEMNARLRNWSGNSRPGNVVWGWLFAEIVLEDWESTPRNVASARVEMVQALFRHGASPNAPYAGMDNPYATTIWAWFSAHVRSVNLERDLKVPRGSGPRLEVLAKLTEVLVNAGAEVGGEGSLTVEEVGKVFPPRLASRIAEAMKRQSRLQNEKTGLERATGTWAGWFVSWVWNGWN